MDSYLALEKMLLILCADLAIIIGSSRVFGWLFGKVGQPPVVGEILAGVILGPSLLGRLYPDAIQTMLTPQTTAVLSAIAQIGLVLLMLLIGLEFPVRPPAPGGAGLDASSPSAGIVVPFASSYALAGYLYRISPPSSAPELAFRLFFATAVSITAIPIMGRILIHTRPDAHAHGADLDHGGGDRRRARLDPARRGRVHGDARRGPTSLALSSLGRRGAAVASRSGRSGASASRDSRSGTRSRAASRRARSPACWSSSSPSAMATNALGVFSIFGGFLCGIAGSFNRDLAEGIRTSIGDLVAVLFLPIFFVFSGLRTDIGSLGSDPRLWVALGLVILVACASKFGATALAARATGLPWKESLSIGLLMNTRALMALVVINIGADMGVISPTAVLLARDDGPVHDGDHDADPAAAYPSPEATGGGARPKRASARSR